MCSELAKTRIRCACDAKSPHGTKTPSPPTSPHESFSRFPWTPGRRRWDRRVRLARRLLLLLLLVMGRRRAACPAFEADADRIDVRQLEGRKRQRDRVGHDAKDAGRDSVCRGLDPVGLRKDLLLVAVARHRDL